MSLLKSSSEFKQYYLLLNEQECSLEPTNMHLILTSFLNVLVALCLVLQAKYSVVNGFLTL